MTRLHLDRVRTIGTALAVARTGIGIVALLAPSITSKALGFPPDADTPSARLVARFFGLREIAMGVLTLTVLRRNPGDRRLMAWNAAVDGSDAILAGLALARRSGIDRAALGTIALAVPLCASWLWLLRQGAREEGRT